MKPQLANLIHQPFNRVERMLSMGEIHSDTFRSYRAVWEWCSPRFTGFAGAKQDAFYQKHGRKAYNERVNKVRVSLGFYPIPFNS